MNPRLKLFKNIWAIMTMIVDFLNFSKIYFFEQS